MTTTEYDQDTTVTARDAFCDGLHQLAAWLRDADPAIPVPYLTNNELPIYFHDFDAYRRILRGLQMQAVMLDRQDAHYVWKTIDRLHFGPIAVQLVGFEPRKVHVAPPVLFADIEATA